MADAFLPLAEILKSLFAEFLVIDDELPRRPGGGSAKTFPPGDFPGVDLESRFESIYNN